MLVSHESLYGGPGQILNLPISELDVPWSALLLGFIKLVFLHTVCDKSDSEQKGKLSAGTEGECQ